VDTDKSIYLEY